MTATDASAALAAIRAREQAATDGPWYAVEEPEREEGNYTIPAVIFVASEDHPDGFEVCRVSTDHDDDPVDVLADAEFIAHARDDVRRMAVALDAVLALHREVGVYDVCEHTNGDECDAWETVDGEFVCGAPVDRVCDECRDECGDRLGYPCATVAAIADALGEDA